MRKILILVCFIALNYAALAQKTYTINNETLELKTEVNGTLDLLWNTFDGKFRYFLKDNNDAIHELVNTKNSNNNYLEEYKTVLNSLTNNRVSTEKVNLTLASLKTFINSYNASQDSSYTVDEKAKLKTRLSVFGGLTNNLFVENLENKSVPFFGTEFEFFEQNKMPRHAGFLSLRHALEHDDFKYSVTQFALGYRFRFINQPNFNIYGNAKLVTYSFTKSQLVYEDSTNPEMYITEDKKANGFDVPFIFGLGADIKINTNSFITLAYHDIVALFIDNQDNFPIDFAIGYKFNL